MKKRYNERSHRMSFKVEINPELKMKSDIMFKAFYRRKENEEFLQDVQTISSGKSLLSGEEA